MASISINRDSNETIRIDYNTDFDTYLIFITYKSGEKDKSIELTPQELFTIKDCIDLILERK